MNKAARYCKVMLLGATVFGLISCSSLPFVNTIAPTSEALTDTEMPEDNSDTEISEGMATPATQQSTPTTERNSLLILTADGLLARPSVEFSPCSLLPKEEVEAITGPIEAEPLPEYSVGEGMPDPIQAYGCYYFYAENFFTMSLDWVPTQAQMQEYVERYRQQRESLGELEVAEPGDYSFWSPDEVGMSISFVVQRSNIMLSFNMRPVPDAAGRQFVEELAESILSNIFSSTSE